MPLLTQLRVNDFRNLESIDIYPASKINFIYGENGAGKTSLLEAISVLAIGRSFRTRKYKHLVAENKNVFTLFTRSNGDSRQPESHTVGIQRGASDIFRIDGKDIQSSGQLASLLPSLVINAKSFELIEGSAKQRRMFFDWLVFHVKHEFAETWKSYGKCLKQRNTLLRHDKITYSLVEPWDQELVKISLKIKALREECFRLFIENFEIAAKRLQIDKLNITLNYYHGWKEEADLQDLYRAGFERDRNLGYTNVGPHKAEMKVQVRNIPAIEKLSRGQQKLLVSAFIMNQASLFIKIKKEKPIFLIDDLPAELDEINLKIIGQWILELETQTFITAIEKKHAAAIWDSRYLNEDFKMFHVKHGQIFEQDL